MKRLFFLITTLLLSLTIIATVSPPVQAAVIRGGDHIDLSSNEHLENVYSFGQNITSNASISGDLVTAGESLLLHGSTTGSVMAAGEDISLDSQVGNSVRAAGGTITISGPVTHDVVVAGGTVTIEKSASISGDLIFIGGTLEVHGPVGGNIQMRGGNVILSSKVGGNVQGDVGTLELRNGAEIGGDLTYTAPQKALISDGAIVHGQETYHVSSQKGTASGVSSFIARGIFYKLITDILFSLLLVYLFPGIIARVNKNARTQSFKNGVVGLLFLLFTPLIAAILIIIIWLGISLFLLYLLFLILALMVGKILLGWWILQWWSGRNKTDYVLDWKAAVIGPLLLTIIFLIPIIGWLAVAGIYLVTLGSLLQASIHLRTVPKLKA